MKEGTTDRREKKKKVKKRIITPRTRTENLPLRRRVS